jgi:integrase
MKTPNMKHIQNRNGHLYFRMRIPADCRAALNGKGEANKSLGLRADQIDEAEAQAKVLATAWKKTFASIRDSTTKYPPPLPAPTGCSLEEAVRNRIIHPNAERMLDELLNNQRLKQCKVILDEVKETYDSISDLLDKESLNEEALKETNGLALFGAYNEASPPPHGNIDKILSSYPTTDKDDRTIIYNAWTFACAFGIQNKQRIMRGILGQLLMELQYIANEIVRTFPKLDMVKQWSRVITQGMITAPQHQSSTASMSDSYPISEVLAECLAIKKRTIKAENDIRTETLRFLAWHKLSESKPINSITVSQMIDYRDNCLQHLPRNANKLRATKVLPIRGQIAYGKTHGLQTISTTTVNNRLTSLGVVFGYAKRRHYVNFAVSEGLHLTDEKKQAKLSGFLFTGYSNQQMADLIGYLESHKNMHRKGYEWRYWIPLLLAYTGCRANEIAMLTVDDVNQENGTCYLDLRNDATKRQRVKNAMSVRRVPVCRKIIDRGFIEYTEETRNRITLRHNPDRRLWESLVFSETSKWVRQLSYYFNKTIRPALNAQDVTSGLHGLRSSVCRALQQQDIAQRTIDELTGHQPEGISRVALGYQGRLPLDVLALAVEIIDWHSAANALT